MKGSLEHLPVTPPNEIGAGSVTPEQPNESIGVQGNIETKNYTGDGTTQERVDALEEGIRLTKIGRDSALADLERWRNTNTTESSHFEFHLPEIQNRISRAEHNISSSQLDINLINSGAKSPEQKDAVIKSFIAGQVLDGRTANLRDKLSSFDKRRSDFNERLGHNHEVAEKLQAELNNLNTSIESDDSDIDRLKLSRREVLIEMNQVSDRYEVLMHEKGEIDALSSQRETVQSQINEIVTAGVADEELPKSIAEDPDFAACLKEANSYKSEDDRRTKAKSSYNPRETAIKLFSDRFPQKSSYYERLATSVINTVNEKGEQRPGKLSSIETTRDKLAQMPNEFFEDMPAKALASNQSLLKSEQVEVITSNDKEISKNGIVSYIQTEKATGTLNTEADYENLKAAPIIDTKRFYEIEPSRAEKSTFELVDTRKIIGRPNADNYENGWAHEYNERAGRIGEIVDQINNPDNEAGLERIFHTEDQPGERIKLACYEGPAGPIYSVFDGTHRVAGVKASGLEKMPAEVFRTKYPYEKTTADKEEIADWQDKIDGGFITGSIETIETENGERFVLKVQSEVVPWIRVRNQNDIFKINQAYEKQYPGALELVGFPKETLTDRTAFWAYMDGNFEQWRQQSASSENLNQGQ